MSEGIRRRLSEEDGLSIVEVMVSSLVLVIGVLALLTTLIASAHSVVDQRARTGATRVAAQQAEVLRARGYDNLRAAINAGTLGGTATLSTVDGRVYRLTTSAVERDAQNGGAPRVGHPTVIRATSTVTWTSVRGGDRSSTFTTAIARDASAVGTLGSGCTAGAERSIESINLLPSPTTVDAAGVPLQPVQVRVKLCGFAATSLVQVRWENAGEGPQFLTLTSDDGGITWTAVIDRTRIRRPVLEGEMGSLDVTLLAGSLDQIHSLELTRQSSIPMSIATAAVAPNPIRVEASGGSCNGSSCRNLDEVLFTATTTGLDPVRDAVKVRYELFDGTFREVALTYNPAALRWEHRDPPLSVKYKRGLNQPFTFVAMRSEPMSTIAIVVNRTVTS